MFHLAWLIGCALSIDEQMIGSKVRHVYEMIISLKRKGGVFQVDALCDEGYTDAFYCAMKVLQMNTN